MPRERVFNGVPLAPQVIERIKNVTQDCPNLIFGTPDYPYPAVACGKMNCKVLEEGCINLPGAKPMPEEVQTALGLVLKPKQERPQPSPHFIDPARGYDI